MFHCSKNFLRKFFGAGGFDHAPLQRSGIKLLPPGQPLGTKIRYTEHIMYKLVGAGGFEPPTTRTPSEYATGLRHAPC
jgi:hypothetical protein